ncbi:hypothetical protein A1F96_09932 [Pyrenophora tritici-repentis]|nr:hypothetical protein A1F96_09932 [Pyrenophora tritici-repentis]
MAAFPAANPVAYQTYATPMAGEKRKRSAVVNKSELADQYDTIPEPRAKKSCADTEEYNPKNMANMCFSAYALRLHKAALPTPTEDLAEDFRQDLFEMFTHAHTKRNFEQGTAARHVIPRLAGNPNSTRTDKDRLVRDFIEHYRSVRKDLEAIEKLYLSDKPANDEFIATMRSHVAGLHKSLADAAKWRGILRYTPLSKACLNWLIWSIAYRKPYQLLDDLINYINDVNDWLTIPPPEMDLHPDIRAAMKTLKAARLRKKAEEQLHQQNEKERDLERREEKNCGLRPKKHSSGQTSKPKEAKQQLKELEDATRERVAEYAAANVEREDAYQTQMFRNADEVEKLKIRLSEVNAQSEVQEAALLAAKSQTEFREAALSTANARIGKLETELFAAKAQNDEIYSMLQPFVPTSGSPDPMPMEGIEPESARSSTSGTVGFLKPGLWDQTQPIQFSAQHFADFDTSYFNGPEQMNDDSIVEEAILNHVPDLIEIAKRNPFIAQFLGEKLKQALSKKKAYARTATKIAHMPTRLANTSSGATAYWGTVVRSVMTPPF